MVWWDPRALKLGAEAPLGLRRPELIVKDVAPAVVDSGLAAYNSWRERRQQAISAGSQGSVALQTVTQAAKTVNQPDLQFPPIEIVELPRAANRPSGRRFGTLVHAVLASVPLDGDLNIIQRLATIHGRILGAPQDEVDAASESVRVALAHRVFEDARQAAQQGRCRREVPIAWRDSEGSLIEGAIDLAFERAGSWTVIDFKTDEELRADEPVYRRQVGMYAAAISAANGSPVAALLMRV